MRRARIGSISSRDRGRVLGRAAHNLGSSGSLFSRLNNDGTTISSEYAYVYPCMCLNLYNVMNLYSIWFIFLLNTCSYVITTKLLSLLSLV